MWHYSKNIISIKVLLNESTDIGFQVLRSIYIHIFKFILRTKEIPLRRYYNSFKMTRHYIYKIHFIIN